jgi:hypothetical protein
MLGLARAERKASRFVKDNVDIDEIYDQLNTLMSLSSPRARAGARAANTGGRATTLPRRRKRPRRS